MRAPHLRFTIRRMMLLVAVVAFTAQCAITAYHIKYDRECQWLVHEWERVDGPVGPPKRALDYCASPIWPQLWRKVLRQPWPGTFRCECWEGERLIGIGVGTECRLHRCVSAHAASRQEVEGFLLSSQSLKNIGNDVPLLPPVQSSLPEE